MTPGTQTASTLVKASRVLRLTLLAPDIVERILDGRQPAGVTLDALLRPFPMAWDQTRRTLLGNT